MDCPTRLGIFARFNTELGIRHRHVLAAAGGPLRYSQEFTTNGTLRWDDFNTLNARADYRRPVGPVDFIAFVDIFNVLASVPSDEREFNATTGELIAEDGEAIPFFGIRFEKTWQ